MARDAIKEAVAEHVIHGADPSIGGLEVANEHGEVIDTLWSCEMHRIGSYEALIWVPGETGPRRCFRVKVSEVL